MESLGGTARVARERAKVADALVAAANAPRYSTGEIFGNQPRASTSKSPARQSQQHPLPFALTSPSKQRPQTAGPAVRSTDASPVAAAAGGAGSVSPNAPEGRAASPGPDAPAPGGASPAVSPQRPARPMSAPGLRGTGPVAVGPEPPVFKQHGRVSLYDRGTPPHEVPGPKVLRDYSPSWLGFPLRGPDHYLKQGDGKSLRVRNNLTAWLKRHPVNREPPFVKGSGGVKFSWADVQQPASLFRYLYDNGTIDFVAMRWGGLQNRMVWGKKVRAGQMTWVDWPEDMEIAKWLPIFLEGVREYQEPYRFLAIRGSEALIAEAGPRLHECAADCVPPLRKALESREPTAVAVALELMLMTLRVDPEVARVWIYHLWQFAQVMNLFISKAYKVDMGYNSREIASIRQLCFDILLELEQHGGEHATALIRRYCRGVDPAVTDESMARRTKQAKDKPGFQPWKPFTLF